MIPLQKLRVTFIFYFVWKGSIIKESEQKIIFFSNNLFAKKLRRHGNQKESVNSSYQLEEIRTLLFKKNNKIIEKKTAKEQSKSQK